MILKIMSENIKEVVSWLGLLGIPTIGVMAGWCIRSCAKFARQMKVLMSSQQAQMRSNLLKDYKKFIAQGWIEIDDLDDWENQYQKYHLLGANGVMDSKRQELMSLPNIKPAKSKTTN